ncbi:MAG: polymer-forming cytoskeletal protein [Myxococcota bacterium]|nr:polymer-forming cytoskeletal protein [Myxococcota bacterium]
MFRHRSPLVLALVLVLPAMPGIASADDGDRDRVAFGGDAVVAAGETVQSVAAFGGDAIVAGRVEGDVVAFGGDIELAPSADVTGSVAVFGGELRAAEGARFDRTDAPRIDAARAPRHGSGLGAWLEDVFRQAVAHGLLFLLALLMMGVAPERLGAMQVAIVRDPVRTGLFGLAGYVGSVVLIVALAITILGIPVAVALAVLLPLATYVGLAAAATVIGAALPIERLSGRPVRQLAAGVVLLFLASVVPFLGTLTVIAASCLGYGALIRTRFKTTPPTDLLGTGPIEAGPYRTSAV